MVLIFKSTESGPTRDPRIEISLLALLADFAKSGPTRDPRIEIPLRFVVVAGSMLSGPTRDPRIEIASALSLQSDYNCRVPHGTRGLK